MSNQDFQSATTASKGNDKESDQTDSDEKENNADLTIRYSTKLLLIKTFETSGRSVKEISSVEKRTQVEKIPHEGTTSKHLPPSKPSNTDSEKSTAPKTEDEKHKIKINYETWPELETKLPLVNIQDYFQDLLSTVRYTVLLEFGEDLMTQDDLTKKPWLWWRYLLSGGLAGTLSRTCTAPLDRMKFYLQVQQKPTKYMVGLYEMIAEGGARSLWRGNGINILKIAPESAIKFLSYEKIKHCLLALNADANELSIFQRFLAGSTAGVLSQSIIYPLEVLKTRLMLRKTGQYSGIWHAASNIYRHEGSIAFYRGFAPNIIGIIPFAGVDLATYEALKSKWLELSKQQEADMILPLVCGSVSSCLGQSISYPFSLIRTRMQANRYGQQVTLRMAMKDILQNEGFGGFYRGILTAYMKLIPSVSISYIVYEYANRVLNIKMM